MSAACSLRRSAGLPRGHLVHVCPPAMAPLRLTRVRESYDVLAGQLETSVQGVLWEPHGQFDVSDTGEVVVQCACGASLGLVSCLTVP